MYLERIPERYVAERFVVRFSLIERSDMFEKIGERWTLGIEVLGWLAAHPKASVHMIRDEWGDDTVSAEISFFEEGEAKDFLERFK